MNAITHAIPRVFKSLLATGLMMSMSWTIQAGLTADEIVAQVDAVDKGNTSRSQMQMILIDDKDRQRTRDLLSTTKMMGPEDNQDEYKLIFFTAPSNVKDTGFLTYDYTGDKEDDQWLYLPALGKSKRIPAADKTSAFMGSDFTYADMTERNINDYTYKLMQEKEVAGHMTWLLEATPKSQKVIDNTGYTKSYMFIRQDNFMVVQALHLMPDNYRKYMTVRELEQIDGIWVATDVEMKTTLGKVRQHTTILKLSDVQFNQPVSDETFTLRQLEKGL
ncbi:MAG TPA: outer membrane lipoprotein-sorting protein [Oceanospirillaceae bacterium]|nr:outer membrane lipoprotein-sorting protein [Oceanospirillaceae bacterium]